MKHPWLIALAAASALLMLIALTFRADAHDWYTGLKNAAGELCCGGQDCAPLADGDVTEVPGGYAIASLGVTVPFGTMQPSPDGLYHACRWGTPKVVKCFFGPLPSY